MQISQSIIEKDPPCTGIQRSTCPFDSESGAFCHAAVMTVVMSGHQKRTYCWTDHYYSCPVFFAKIVRGR
jgi:hypothetical protein